MKKKTKATDPDKVTREAKKNKEAKEAVAAALKKARAGSFGSRVGKIFLRVVFLISLSFFSVIFGGLAFVLMPIALPLAYIASAIRGDKLKI